MHTVGGKDFLSLFKYNYQRFIPRMGLFSATRSYGVPLVATFVGNEFNRIRHQLNVKGYKVLSNAHSDMNKAQEIQLVEAKK